MAEKPKPTLSGSGDERQIDELPPIFEGSHAPILFIDAAATFGHQDGVINLTLVTRRITPSQDGPVTDLVVTGHLRMSIRGAISLKTAIDNALLLAAPSSGTSGEPH